MTTTPVITEHDVTVHLGDARHVLAELPAESVQCVVTSPPYYGLRDYGTGTWDGGADDCDHIAAPHSSMRPERSRATSSTFHGSMSTNHSTAAGTPYRDVCGKCGAARVDRQIGLEPSPAEYVETMRAVFAEARRVLAKDGTLWLNIGDSYSSAKSGEQSGTTDNPLVTMKRAAVTMLPAKNLLGIPWRVAFALQNDGWTLRNDIIWAKPNAMPESVTDRLSTRYEHVFLFSKSRRYWFDLDAVREPHVVSDEDRGIRNGRNQFRGQHAMRPGGPNAGRNAIGGRNPGDVWTIPTSPFPGAHFATMPPELVKRCIATGCPLGGTVLDPFAGSGTTLMVARRMLRRSVGIELNAAYVPLIWERIGDTPLDFGADVRVAAR
jgi:site-specific DNA-methyltransferase (cytosine-N4-specific)